MFGTLHIVHYLVKVLRFIPETYSKGRVVLLAGPDEERAVSVGLAQQLLCPGTSAERVEPLFALVLVWLRHRFSQRNQEFLEEYCFVILFVQNQKAIFVNL